MEPLSLWMVVVVLVSAGLAMHALWLAARVRADLRLLARLASVQLLEPGLTLGLFLLLRQLAEPSWGSRIPSEWAVWAFVLTGLQLAPLLFRSRSPADLSPTLHRLGALGLWRWGLSSVGVGALVLTGLLENPGAIAELGSLDNLLLFLAGACLLVSVPLFCYALTELVHTLRELRASLERGSKT